MQAHTCALAQGRETMERIKRRSETLIEEQNDINGQNGTKKIRQIDSDRLSDIKSWRVTQTEEIGLQESVCLILVYFGDWTELV